jgi:Tfp pilus assembly protein PilX
MSENRSIVVQRRDERGVALIMTMLVMALMSALLIGFSAVVASDQRYRTIDRDRVRAFYAAQSGLEKLSADLANQFKSDVSLSAEQLHALGENPPPVPDATFTTGVEGGLAYAVTPIPLKEGEDKWKTIASGPYEGLMAAKERYWLDSSVRTTSGGEAHLRRKVESVAIPVFQFGIFSDVDLSFSAADTFDFRGRVHTNGNLFLAQAATCSPYPCTLWLRDRVTAAGQIVRQRLSNNVSISTSSSTGRVRVATGPNGDTGVMAFRDLARTEGSVLDGVIPTFTVNPAWSTLSLSTYKGYLRNGETGAKKLNLQLIKPEVGGSHIDLIRRPRPNEKQALLEERNFWKSSVRILLSDLAQDIMSLPTIDTAVQPVSLDGDWAAAAPAGYGPISVARPPVARVPDTGATSTGTIGANVLPGNVTAGTSRTITMGAAGIPPYFRMPQLTITNAAGAPATPTCSGKTLTTFTGCGNPPPGFAGVNVTAVIDGVPVSAPFRDWNAAGQPAGTIRVTAGSTTQDFSPNTFWVLNGTNGTAAQDNQNLLVTCEGYDTVPNPDQFTRCNVPGIPGVPATSASLLSTATLSAGSLTQAVSTIGGFIKIEMQVSKNQWRDVTMEILNYGIAGRNLEGRTCDDPTPNAILRLQRFQDNFETDGATPCSYTNVHRATYFMPNVLFDAREAIYRDAIPADRLPRLGGVMHYIALDVRNLSNWFRRAGAHAGGTGNQAYKDPDSEGFSVYFSDRRNNRNASGEETGEYGFEDVVNPNSASGTPNGIKDDGEDMNIGSTTTPVLDDYGQYPTFNGAFNAVPPGAQAPLIQSNLRPIQGIRAPYAQVNRAVLFRRALKLINGGAGNIVAPGLTITSENPVYIQGDWNATTGGADPFAAPHVATSVVADAVTLLSGNWNDNNSFRSPYTASGRARQDSSYRLAIISGKGPIFQRPGNGEGTTFGTDGGVHSFLRFLEGNDGTVNYRGSMATLYYHRQAISPFKCCGVPGNGDNGGIVYDVPTRVYSFDLDFLNPALLPPLTPLFRDTNALGFTQETRPGK